MQQIPDPDYCDFVLYSETYNLEFYSIPKNGMTTITHHLQIKGIPRLWINNPTPPTVFCVLRNPIHRTVSSYAWLRDWYALNTGKPTMFRQLDNQKVQDMFFGDLATGFQLYIDELFDYGPFDDHNVPQYMFLSNQLCPHTIATLSLHKMTRSIANVNNFINFDNMNESIGTMIGDLNFSMDDQEFHPTPQETKDLLLPIANTVDNRNKILVVYQQDYDLFIEKFPTSQV